MINKVTLIGHLGGDPEVRHLENGVMVARFSVATNESYKDKNGEWQDQTEWHNVVAWRDLAERAEKLLKKGKLVYIDGKLSTRKYTGSDNIERWATDVIANNFRLLEKREGGGTGGGYDKFPSVEQSTRYANGADNTNSGNGTVTMPADTAAPAEGDDLPF